METKKELCARGQNQSNFTYWEFSESRKTLDFPGSHSRALAYFSCVPRVTVPDNLKSGVTTPCRYEPELNLSYERFAEHCGTTILPARVRALQDKAKVEGAVRLAQRWLLGRLLSTTDPPARSLRWRRAEDIRCRSP